jgi:hypothetical protein
MRHGVLKLGAAVAGIATIGMATAYVAVPSGGEEEVASQAEAPTPGPEEEAVLQGGTFQDCIPRDLPPQQPTPIKGVPLPNPDEGLTDAEVMAKHERGAEEAEARVAGWLECLDFSKIDFRSLPIGFTTVGYLEGEPTLPAAVGRADLIVVVSVSDIRVPRFTGHVQATLSVERTIKGAPVSTVALTQGGISPTVDWTGATLNEFENGPMLFPGDRAVLLLQQYDTGYEIQSFSGWYRVADGKVEALRLNTFGAEVAGKTEQEFIEMLTAAVQETAPS